MYEVCICRVPCELFVEMREQRVVAAQTFLTCDEKDETKLLEQLVIVDELWIHYMTPRSLVWKMKDKLLVCAYGLFCTKFNPKLPLVEQFFKIIGNLGPGNESTFPFQYNIIFETCQSFEPPSSTLGQDRQECPLTFLYKIFLSKTFIWTFFYIIGNFCKVQP